MALLIKRLMKKLMKKLNKNEQKIENHPLFKKILPT